MKKHKRQLSQLEKLQKKLDARFGKGIYKAAIILFLFGSLSLVSCQPESSSSVQNTTTAPTTQPNPRVPPNAITITDTGQTATLNERPTAPDAPEGDLERITDVYFAKKVVQNNRVSFTPIDSAHVQNDAQGQEIAYDSILGKTVYLILETENLEGQQLDVVLRSSNAQMNEDNDTMQLMFFNETNRTMQPARIKRTRVGNTDALLPRPGVQMPYTDANLQEFRNTAIIKLQLRPQTRERFNEWAQALGDGTANLEVLVERFPNAPCAYGDGTEEVDTAGVFLNDDTARFRVANRNFYEIYHGENAYNFLPMNGNNRRRIAKLENTQSNQVAYFYYDQHDNEHWVCEAEKHSFIQLGNGQISNRNNPRGNEQPVSTIDYTPYRAAGEDINATTSYTYRDGTVVTTGNYRNRLYILYPPLNQTSFLLSMPELNINQAGGITIMYSFRNTRRRFCQPDFFAVFIGGLAQTGFTNVTSGGSAFGDGSCYPSVAHNNGNAIDFGYLAHNNHQTLINALYDYGFNRFLIGCNMRYTHGTPDCGSAIHDDHTHADRIRQGSIESII